MLSEIYQRLLTFFLLLLICFADPLPMCNVLKIIFFGLPSLHRKSIELKNQEKN